MKLTDRQRDILCSVVEEYTRIGIPIGSRLLRQKYDFGISSALIRSELHELMEGGFLSQPHTSGGRVPTDKGYRFFITTLQEELSASHMPAGRRTEHAVNDMFASTLKDVVETLAEFSRALGVGYSFKPPEVYKKGFDELLGRMQFQTHDDMVEVAHDIEELDACTDDVREMFTQERNEPFVFIGKESPFTKSSALALMMDRYTLNGGEEVVMMIVGPRRMNYKKNFIFMRMMKEKLQ